jgi:hypothetical protein
MKNFKREQRYIVIKHLDAIRALSEEESSILGILIAKVDRERNRRGQKPFQSVLVEHDWKCYEAVWKMIEDEAQHG